MATQPAPGMRFLFRLEVEMSTENRSVGAPFDGTQHRIIMPILGGKVIGPKVNGEIVANSGGDYAVKVKGAGFQQLDARYILKTDDGHYIYVQSKGIENDVDWFTRVEMEVGPGPYNWLNSVFAIGQLTKTGQTIHIDVYQVTKAPNDTIISRKAQL